MTSAGDDVGVRLWSHEGGRFRAPAGAHDGYELAWAEVGEITYRIGGVEHVLRAGEALLVPGAVEHATWFDGPAVVGALALEAPMVEQLADALGRSAGRLEAGLVQSSVPISRLGAVIREEATAAEAGHALAIASLAETIVIATIRGAARRPSRPPPADPRVRHAIERVRTSYADAIQVDDLAAAAGMSRFHFSRIFREATGFSPYQYLIKTRVERAADLLRTGRTSVTEAAFAVGFGDLGRFARSFRATMGTSPAQFAASAGAPRRRST